MVYGELRCDRCHRPYEGQMDWTFIMKGGFLVEVVCPDCRALGEADETYERR